MKQLIQTKCPTLLLALLVYAVTLLSGCKGEGYGSPQGYDLNKPREMQLGKVLNEISGLDYMDEDSMLMAISDSKEKVFGIDLKTKKLKDLTDKAIPKDSDTEDVVFLNDSIYLLSSWGEIRVVAPGARDTLGLDRYTMNLDGTNDFETMYHDPTAKALILICKTCENEKRQGIRTAYRFDLQTRQFDTTAFFTISKTDIESLLKDTEAKVDPSSAAINPIDKRLYILSSAGNLLIVTDTRGKVIEAYKLNPDKFPQPEGIAFAPNGDMYISNEGKYGKPTLLFFKHQTGKKK